MGLEKLLNERIIQKITPDRNSAMKTFSIAVRDIETARKLLEAKSYDWCLAISYNAMLQAARALMFSEGYKPSSEYKHVAVVRFVNEGFEKELTERMINVLDRMRKKRHSTVYDSAEVLESEAKQSIQWAEEFAEKIKKILETK